MMGKTTATLNLGSLPHMIGRNTSCSNIFFHGQSFSVTVTIFFLNFYWSRYIRYAIANVSAVAILKL